jgi:hypothetical protein
MSYTFLLESGEESSADCFSGIPLFAPSRSTLIAEEYSSVANGTAFFLGSPCGTMSEPSTGNLGGDGFNWFAAGFPAPTFPKYGKMPRELTGPSLDFGQKWRESSVRFDLASCGWKTHHCWFNEDLSESSVTLPEWGTMQGGECWEQDTPVLAMHGTDFGFWATPTARDWKDTAGMKAQREDGKSRLDQLPRQVFASVDGNGLFMPPTAPETWMEVNSVVPSAAASMENALALDLQWARNSTTKSETESSSPDLGTLGQLNVEFPEWLNGLPIGWTDLSPLETAKYRRWLHSHGLTLGGGN